MYTSFRIDANQLYRTGSKCSSPQDNLLAVVVNEAHCLQKQWVSSKCTFNQLCCDARVYNSIGVGAEFGQALHKSHWVSTT